MSATKELIDRLRAAQESYSADLPISAEIIANQVISDIDREGLSPDLVRWAAILELRQLVRPLLRKEYEDEESPQNELPGFQLQDRYPGSGDRKGLYLPRGMMSFEDYSANIERLDKESAAKKKHARALESERDTKFPKSA